MVVVAEGAVVGSPDAVTSESKIATVQSTVGVRRCSFPSPLPRQQPFRWGRGRTGGWAGNEGGAAAAAALAALLSACSERQANRDLTIVGMSTDLIILCVQAVGCDFSCERKKNNNSLGRETHPPAQER